jgi:hypothetical protein
MPESEAQAQSKFSELLAAIGDGTLEEELSGIVVNLAAKLRQMGEHGGKPAGQIQLKVKMKFDRGVFEVDSDVSVKEPQTVRPRTLMYPARDGGLSRNNSQQMEAFSDKAPRDERPARTLPFTKGANQS